MTIGTAVGGVGDRRNTSKLAYYSDEEEDDAMTKHQGTAQRGVRPNWSASGRTQMTAQNQQNRFNIADENDDVNL